MSTVVVRQQARNNSRRNGQAQQAQGRSRQSNKARPVVVQVQPSRNGRRPRRRGGRRSSRRRGSRMASSRSHWEDYKFTINNLKASDAGVVKFGPSISQCSALKSGIFKSFHEFKITNLNVKYVTHAASTTSGAFAVEVDTSCTQTTLKSHLQTVPVTKCGQFSWPAGKIRGTGWLPTPDPDKTPVDADNQFFLLYAGNGSSSVAGQFVITARCWFQSPRE
nr:coat protein P3 [Rose spring dwarf-associated virus]